MGQPRVEILYTEDCPNRERACELVVQLAERLGRHPDIELVEVADDAAAVRLRFLGSPSIRIDGRDVEPGADDRTEFALACRIYRTAHGVTGLPDEAWIRAALVVKRT
jgi:hypothetical protein